MLYYSLGMGGAKNEKKGLQPDLNRVGGGKMLLHQHEAEPRQNESIRPIHEKRRESRCSTVLMMYRGLSGEIDAFNFLYLK